MILINEFDDVSTSSSNLIKDEKEHVIVLNTLVLKLTYKTLINQTVILRLKSIIYLLDIYSWVR